MFTDTILIDIANFAQYILAVLGGVMSLVIFRKRSHKGWAVALFVVLGAAGFVSAHFTAASAERQQVKADEQQGALRKEMAALRKAAEDASKRPIEVTAIVPKEPEPKITFDWKIIDSKIIESIHEDNGWPYAVQLTIRSDKEVLLPDIEITCTSPIADAALGEGAEGYHADHPEGKTWRFTITPKLARAKPWTIILFGEEPIDGVSAHMVR